MTSKFTRLLLLTLIAVFTAAPIISAADTHELTAVERDELEAQLDEARAQLDAAAHKLGELHSRLYAIETVGGPGQKPMLGVLIGERGPNGGLLLAGVTPGGGGEAAGLQAGDEITSVNNVDLTEAASAMAELKEAMSGVAAGETVSVGYQRNGGFQLASVTTQAKGVYMIGMMGAPAVHIDVEAIEEMAHKAAAQYGTVEIDPEWIESLEALESLKALESLEELQVLEGLGPQMHRAIRIGGPGAGLRLESVSGDLAGYFGVPSGVLVMSVPKVKEQAPLSLKAGDILLAVDGEPIQDAGDGYRTLMGGQHAADGGARELAVEIMRQGARQTVQLTPAQLGGGAHSISIRSSGPHDMNVEIIAPPAP